MSRFTVNLNESPPSAADENKNDSSPESFEQETVVAKAGQISASPVSTPPGKKRFGLLKKLAVIFGAIILALFIGGFFYWQSVKKTPAYSLALLVDAARRDDKAAMEQLVDTEAVVDDFMPQVTAKAIELYGRNLSPQAKTKVEQVAAPVIPIIKERAKAELPRVIREKTAPVERVPYWLIALFADRAVEVKTEGEKALVKSKIPERPLELTMRREGDGGWKVIAMKDDVLARKIAERIGQDIIAAAAKGGLKKAAEQMGVKDLDSLKEMDIFK